jgi:hypothetical protein
MTPTVTMTTTPTTQQPTHFLWMVLLQKDYNHSWDTFIMKKRNKQSVPLGI